MRTKPLWNRSYKYFITELNDNAVTKPTWKTNCGFACVEEKLLEQSSAANTRSTASSSTFAAMNIAWCWSSTADNMPGKALSIKGGLSS